MPRTKTKEARIAGKLISEIQKVWGQQLGEPLADETEDIMNLAHDLLQAQDKQAMARLLAGRTVFEYLGEAWLQQHATVAQIASELNDVIEGKSS